MTNPDHSTVQICTMFQIEGQAISVKHPNSSQEPLIIIGTHPTASHHPTVAASKHRASIPRRPTQLFITRYLETLSRNEGHLLAGNSKLYLIKCTRINNIHHRLFTYHRPLGLTAALTNQSFSKLWNKIGL